MANRNNLPGPWNDLNRVQRRINRIFDDFFTESYPALPTSGFGQQEVFSPLSDIEETDNQYLLSVDLPGLKKEDVKIEVRDRQLIVSGERKSENREEAKGRVSTERWYGSFVRSFMLPDGINADKVEADFEDGVLKLKVPKTVSSTVKQIPIKSGKAA